jgi:hypothetical protein
MCWRSSPRSAPAARPGRGYCSQLTVSGWRTFPQVYDRRCDPSVDGARIPPNRSGIAPFPGRVKDASRVAAAACSRRGEW